MGKMKRKLTGLINFFRKEKGDKNLIDEAIKAGIDDIYIRHFYNRKKRKEQKS